MALPRDPTSDAVAKKRPVTFRWNGGIRVERIVSPAVVRSSSDGLGFIQSPL
jgi:hypothetical protein